MTKVTGCISETFDRAHRGRGTEQISLKPAQPAVALAQRTLVWVSLTVPTSTAHDPLLSHPPAASEPWELWPTQPTDTNSCCYLISKLPCSCQASLWTRETADCASPKTTLKQQRRNLPAGCSILTIKIFGWALWSTQRMFCYQDIKVSIDASCHCTRGS